MGHACALSLSLSLSLCFPWPYIRTFPHSFPTILTITTRPSSLFLSLSHTDTYKHIKNHQTVSKMTKVGKLTKLKSAIKRWPSFTKQLSRARSSVASSTNESDDVSKQELHAVYVGKTRRRYLVSSEIIDHPLFQELVEKSSGEYDDGVAVSCEVVLFEHLLWMLDNAENQLGSMDELVEFYTTC
ncbi:auxin-responsive protein SAUR78 [Quercus suber]|uniref:auxin-responsive protein SAUR78 n=1 Tax=Quercus suber TaxID=58331 RepID=UPI0032DEF108